MNRQLIFDLPYRPALDRQDFLVAESNAEAVALIDSWPDWNDPVQAIIGDKACGKSHLAAVWAAKTGAHYISAGALADEKTDDNLADLMNCAALVVDDLEKLPPTGESILFHMINHARQTGNNLLLCSVRPLAKLPVGLPDLASRLAAIICARILPPCDVLVVAVLVKLFEDRQLKVPENVVNYVAPRLERSFFAINQLVSHIDEITLKQKRAITVPLVSDILASLGKGDEKGKEHVR